MVLAIIVGCACRGAFGVGGIKRRLAEAQAERDQGGDEIPSAASSSAHKAAKKSGGGIRQRVVASGDAAAAPEPHRPLFESLKKDWARGAMSSAKVLEHVQGAIYQGAQGMGDIENMDGHNAYRTLMRAFGTPVGAPDFSWLEIPTTKGENTAHPFLMPHEFFQSYARDRARDFQATLSGPSGACSQFWNGLRDTAWFRSHPSLQNMDLSKTIPMGLHGDGAPYAKTDSIFVITWNSLVGQGATAKKRFVFTILRKSEMNRRTLDTVFRIFAWSMNILLSGVTPAASWVGRALKDGGRDLASGWCGAMCQVRGDWDFYREVFNFPAWNTAIRMCWMCQASSTIRNLAWTDLGPDAGWRATRWTHCGYLAYLRAAGLLAPALLTAVLGLRLECIMVDVLHTVDQGVASHIIGNVFWLIAIRRAAFGKGTYEQKIEMLAAHMKQWYKREKCDSKVQGKLTLERVRASGGWPKLKAKAAATRHLAPYALFLMKMFGTEEDQQVLAVCTLLCEFYQILNNESMFMSEAAKARMPVVGLQLSVLYVKLAADAANVRLKMWKMSPKIHIFVHLCEWQSLEWGNPRYYWTYADEDWVGCPTEVAKSCHPNTLAVSALFKWLHVYYE